MTVLEAAILGLVQGLGEFLPISSSAHLVLVPWIMGWQYAGLTFDVALHVGTLFSVVFFFWKDWFKMLTDALGRRGTVEGKLFWYLLAATIPGALIGFLLEDYAETLFRQPLLVGILLMLMGVLLYWADKSFPVRKKLAGVTFSDSMLIGLSQAFAILPGVSRSGVTMTAGRLMGLDRETAARFSFLLSTPIIAGAGILKFSELSLSDINTPFITGVLVSATTGFLAIKLLLKYLTRNSFGIFVWYRLIVGAVVVVLALIR